VVKTASILINYFNTNSVTFWLMERIT